MRGFGDGSKNSNHTRTLAKGSFYAAASKHGDQSNFHLIDFDNVSFSTYQDKAVRLPTRAFSRHVKKSTPPCSIPAQRKTGNANRHVTVSSAVKWFCKRNPGVVVIISGPGAHGRSAARKDHYIKKYGTVAVTAHDDDCVRASLCNAIAVLTGREVTREIQEKLNSDVTVFDSLKPIGPLVHAVKMGLRVREPNNEEITFLREKDRETGFQWLGSRTDVVWIARFEQSGVADHCVCIDAKRRLVFDSEDEYPCLSSATLQICGGDAAKRLRVAEVRKIEPSN